MNSRKKKVLAIPFFIVLALFICHLIFPFQSLAAEDSSSRNAGAEATRFEEEKKLEEQTHADKNKVTLPPAPINEGEAQPLQDKTVTFRLKEVHVVGNKNVTSREIEALTRPSIGKEVSFEDLQGLVSSIKSLYRTKGYVASYAYLPPQNVTEGIIEIRIVEGTLGNLSITGNRWFSDRTLRRYFGLKPASVVFYEDLRRSLTYLNKQRDLQARAVLLPGEKPETTDIEIKVKDHFPLHLGTDVNNLGTENTGKHRVGFSLVDTNSLGFMDPLSGRFQIGKGTWAVGADYNIPVTPIDTRIGFSYARASVDVGGSFKALDVEGDASTYGVYVLQPLIRREHAEIIFNVGFDWKSIKNKILGQTSGKDELRILNTGINTEFTDKWGKTLSPHSFHFGFSDFLGASDKVDPRASRPNSGGQFFIYRGSIVRYQRLPYDMILTLRGVTQLTNDNLVPSEQFRLGGAFSVRGYPEGEYLADYGAYMSSELFIPTYFFPKDWKLPFSKNPLRNQINGVAFFDFGGGVLRNPLVGEEKDRSLAGIGGGLRVNLFDRVYARFQWAAPLASNPNNGASGVFYYGISAEVF